MFKSRISIFLFSLEVLAVASSIWHWIISSFSGWKSGRAFLFITLLLALVFFCAAVFYKLIRLTAMRLSKNTNLGAPELFRFLLNSLSPLILLYLIFLQCIVFLRDIRAYLLPFSLLGSAYLIILLLSRLKRAYPQAIALPEWVRALNPNRFAPRRLSLFVFLLALIAYVLYASGLVFPPQPFTGDEPHYLLITKSMLKDGDINLFNNYEEKDYLEFYPGDLRSHAFRGKKGDNYQYSKHLPAASLLALPGLYLGEKAAEFGSNLSEYPERKRQIIVFFSRLPLCILTALFGLLFFLVARELSQRQDAALLAWAIFSFTTPVLFYSHLIYPEVPAAFIALFLFRYMIIQKKQNLWCVFLSGIGIALLPWLGIKYIVFAGVLLVVSMFTLWRPNPGERWGKILLFIAPVILSAGMYLFFLWSLYGNIFPSSVYRGVALDSSSQKWLIYLMKAGFHDFLSRVVGYFLDQRFGIFFFSPIYVLGIAGLLYFWKQRKREALNMTFVFSVFGIFSAYFYWGGFCPPGRPMIPVIWAWALFTVFAFTASPNPYRTIVKRAAIALSFFSVWMALKNPWLLYHDNTLTGFSEGAAGGELLLELSNAFVNFTKLFPFLGRRSTTWIALAVWMIAIAVLVNVFMKKVPETKPMPFPRRMSGHLSLVFCLSLLVLTYVFFDVHLDRKKSFEGRNYQIFFQDTNHHGHELGGFWTKGKRKTTIVLRSQDPLSHIELSLTGRVEGRSEIQVGSTKRRIERTKESAFHGKVSFSPVKGFPMHKGYLYYITVEDSSGFIPFQLDRKEQDNRYLGVFVQITTRPQSHP